MYNSFKAFTEVAIKKYDQNFEKAALKLYSYICTRAEHTPYVMSDNIHTTDSKRFWSNWMNNPEKYNIKEIFAYNIETKKKEVLTDSIDIDGLWGKHPHHYHDRIVVLF